MFAGRPQGPPPATPPASPSSPFSPSSLLLENPWAREARRETKVPVPGVDDAPRSPAETILGYAKNPLGRR